MKFRLVLLCAFFIFGLSNYCIAAPVQDPQYVGTLTDATDGLTMLKSVQSAMLAAENMIPQQMFDLASKAASQTYSPSQLQEMNQKFQEYKKKYAEKLAGIQVTGPMIFDHGNFIFTKDNKKIVIDLAPKDPEALGISDDNLLSVASAKTAVNHLEIASINVDNWLQGVGTDKSIKKSMNSNIYFNYYSLNLKTDASVESILQSLEACRNDISSQLVQLTALAVKATSDTITPDERSNLDVQFQDLINELGRVVHVGYYFTNLKIFDGGNLGVQDVKGNAYTFGLPELTLESLGISQDDISTPSSGEQALFHLESISDRIHIWLVTGNYDPSYISTRASKMALVHKK